MQQKKAFSLTEILVVVLILSVVVSIMLPVFSKAKDRAKDVVCVSNMHQIYLAMKLYEGDYDCYPPNSVVWPAFQVYYPKPLACPKSKEPNAEFHYLMVGSTNSVFPEAFVSASEGCRTMRGGDYPLIRDMNHLISTNIYLPGSVFFFVRENGSFSSVPADRLKTIKGLCDPSLVPPESNL